jgi:hypothetical protein
MGAREWLDQAAGTALPAVTGTNLHQQCLANRVRLRVTINALRRILDMHRPGSDNGHRCLACGAAYPCPTVNVFTETGIR